jgi:hypothetical protein
MAEPVMGLNTLGHVRSLASTLGKGNCPFAEALTGRRNGIVGKPDLRRIVDVRLERQ